MIVVIKKSDYSCRIFSTLTLAYEEFKNEFEYKLGTLEKQKFPIVLENYVIEKKGVVKKKYSKTNLQKAPIF